VVASINAPSNATGLQIQLDAPPQSLDNDGSTALALRDEAEATVMSLERQLVNLEEDIAELDKSLRSGDNYSNLQAQVPGDSELVQAIVASYPALFQTGVFSTTALAPEDNLLLAAGQEQASMFLNLAQTGTLPTANSPDAPMAATITELEQQLRVLRGQIEVEKARNQQIVQQRDLTWESVKALSNKQAELQLARAAANSEVRLSSIAVPEGEPIGQVSLLTSLILAGMAGLLLGVLAAFLLEMMGARPLRSPHSAKA
jgi:hypothetical protein